MLQEIQFFLDSRDVLPHVDSVCYLADSHKKALGFLPKKVFVQSANAGRLWIAMDGVSNGVIGYLLFGGTYPKLKIWQLYIHTNSRKRGIGAELVSRLKDFAKQHSYSVIQARVATDLPSNQFWERQGLTTYQVVDGGETTGRQLNVRAWEVPEGSLFWKPEKKPELEIEAVRPLLRNPVYVLDLNILFDILRNREGREGAVWALSAAMSGRIRLAVSKEFEVELSRNSKEADPVLAFARGLPVLPEQPESQIENLKTELRPLVFPNIPTGSKRKTQDDSDLKHLAHCILNGAAGFLTRERKLLEASSELMARYGIEVLAPAEFVDDENSIQTSTSVVANGQEVEVTQKTSGFELAIKRFMSQHIDDAEVSALTQKGTSYNQKQQFVAVRGDDVLGYLVVDKSGSIGSGINATLLADLITADDNLAVDQLLEHLQRQISAAHLEPIVLVVPRKSFALKRSLKSRGFKRQRTEIDSRFERFLKVGIRGIIDAARWREVRNRFQFITGQILEPSRIDDKRVDGDFRIVDPESKSEHSLSLFELETLISPGLLMSGSRKGVMVPIQRWFSETLLPQSSPQASLLPGAVSSYRLERAYFSGRNKEALFTRGDLVVFYESLSGGGAGAAIAVARLTSSQYMHMSSAEHLLERQGVISKERLREMSGNDGHVMSFTFDCFLGFTDPVSMKQLKTNGIVGGANLITSQALTPNQLSTVLSMGIQSVHL